MSEIKNYDNYTYPVSNPEAGPGHPGHTTPEDEAKVLQLRAELEAAGLTERLDTHSMLRFLRARKFDVEAAKLMFTETEAWRKSFGVDEIVRSFEYTEKAKMFEYYPQYYHKTDKDGRPVYFEQYGKIDLTKMYAITSEERMLQNLVFEYEKLADPRYPACSRKAGKLIETCCTIMDLKGVGITSVSSVYGFVKKVSAISQNYYPERLGKLYIINAPWGFAGAFKMIKGYLDPVTVEKINILSSNYQAELAAQIPVENLPVLFGGKCECEGGCEWSDAGPWKEEEWLEPVAVKPLPTAVAATTEEKVGETAPEKAAVEEKAV